MGPEQQEMPRTTWISISKGKIVAKKGDQKSEHPGYTAFWVGYKYRTGEEAKFGAELHLLLDVNGQVCDMGMLLKSGYSRTFMRAMQNLDVSKPVTFFPQYKENEDGKYGWMVLFQDGKQVPMRYPSKDLGECPPADMIDDGTGKTTPNYSKQIAFLKAILEGEMHDRLEKQAAAVVATQPAKLEQSAAAPAEIVDEERVAPPPPAPIEGDFEDDLPF